MLTIYTQYGKNSENPQVYLTGSGTYSICLYINTACGTTATACQTVAIDWGCDFTSTPVPPCDLTVDFAETNSCGLGGDVFSQIYSLTTTTWTISDGTVYLDNTSYPVYPTTFSHTFANYGTYTVTATTNFVDQYGNDQGSCTTTHTITLTNPISITPNPASICSGNSLTLSASGGTSYTWTASTGGSSSSGSSITVSPTITTTYTVTNQNDCSNTVTVSVYNCCEPGSGGVAYLGAFSTALSDGTNHITQATGLTIIGYPNVVTSGEIVFNGIWTINKSTTIQNSTIKFGEGAEIYVMPGETLIVDNSTLTDCTDMWQGIYLDGPTAHLIVESSSIIEEAQIAVESNNGGVYTITGSILKNNYIGIQCDAYSFPNAHQGTITGSTIEGLALLDPPDNADWSALGMLITSVYDINIGETTESSNTFTNMSCGIQILNSGVVIANNTFDNMWQSSSYPGALSEIYDNSTVSNTPLAIGNGSTSGINTFDNAEYGIFVTGIVSPFILDNTFEYLRTGVIMDDLGNSAHAPIVAVNNNTMTNITYCGILAEYLQYTSSVQINSNIITGSSGSEYGIYLLRNQWTNVHPTKSTTTKEVESNQIYYFLNGILLTNSNNVTVLSNYAYLPTTTTQSRYGIYNAGSTNCFFDENYIIGQGSPYYNSTEYGFYSTTSSTFSTYRCNQIYSCYTGMLFNGSGNSPITVRSNYFSIGNYGVNLYNGGLIGAQGIAASPQWNKFNYMSSYILYTSDNTDAGSTTALQAANEWYYDDLATDYNIPYATESSAVPLNNRILTVSTTSPTVTVFDSCGLTGIPRPGIYADSATNDTVVFDTLMARLIVQDSLHYIHNVAASQWMDKENLYSVLITDTALIGNAWKSDSVIKHFYDTIQSTNIGSIAQALLVLNTDTTLISGYYEGPAEANEYMDFSPANIVEQNYQTVYGIYINYILADSTLDSALLADLQTIASQCSSTGGAAVYTARGLLAGIYSTPYDSLYSFYYDDSSLCVADTTEAFRMKIATPQPVPAVISGFVTAYPNPAKDQITFVYQYTGADNATLDVYDVLGTKMGEYILKAAKGQYVLGLTNFSNGVYYYRVTTPCCEVGTGKFVLVK